MYTYNPRLRAAVCLGQFNDLLWYISYARAIDLMKVSDDNLQKR